jgi:hypothetical protein
MSSNDGTLYRINKSNDILKYNALIDSCSQSNQLHTDITKKTIIKLKSILIEKKIYQTKELHK